MEACWRAYLTIPILNAAQLKLFSQLLVTLPKDPMHHMVFSPGLKDLVKHIKSSRRGHPQRYWHELNSEYARKSFIIILTKLTIHKLGGM